MVLTNITLITSSRKRENNTMIDARVLGLLASSRDINFDDVLAYELAAYPP